VLTLRRGAHERFRYVDASDVDSWRLGRAATEGELPAPPPTGDDWSFVVGDSAPLFTRLASSFPTLEEVAEVFVGLQSSADDVYTLRFIERRGRLVALYSKALKAEVEVEDGLVRPIVSGTDVTRYAPLPCRQFIIFPYLVEGDNARLYSAEELAEQFEHGWEYLQRNRQRLRGRERGRMRGANWYAYTYPKNLCRQGLPKLCIPRLVDSLYCTHDDGSHFMDNVDVCGIVWREQYAQHSFGYLAGLLNSAVLGWYFPHVSARFRGGWLSANRQFLGRLPVRLINFADPDDVKLHDRLSALAQRMFVLHEQLGRSSESREAQLLARRIAATDDEIDGIVCTLYGVTDEESQITAAWKARGRGRSEPLPVPRGKRRKRRQPQEPQPTLPDL